jgi:hypothetical protein
MVSGWAFAADRHYKIGMAAKRLRSLRSGLHAFPVSFNTGIHGGC